LSLGVRTHQVGIAILFITQSVEPLISGGEREEEEGKDEKDAKNERAKKASGWLCNTFLPSPSSRSFVSLSYPSPRIQLLTGTDNQTADNRDNSTPKVSMSQQSCPGQPHALCGESRFGHSRMVR